MALRPIRSRLLSTLLILLTAGTALGADEIGKPIRFTGTVIHYIAPKTPHVKVPYKLLLRNETETQRFSTYRTPDFQVRVGDIVTVSGHHHRKYAYASPDLHVEKIGHQDLPEPPAVGIGDILSGKFDLRVVRARGTIRDISASQISDQWIIFILACDDQYLYAATPANGAKPTDFSNLIDATVDIDGLCLTDDGSSRHRIGRILHISTTNAIHVVRSETKSPFDVPLVSAIGNLQPSAIAKLGRHRAAGQVIARVSADAILLRTQHAGIIRCTFSHQDCPSYGDFVEVSGYPESNLFHINLLQAQWRACRPFKMQQQRVNDISAAEIFTRREESGLFANARLHGKPLRLRGTVRSIPTQDSPDRIVYLDSDGRFVRIDIRAADEGLLSELKCGCEVEVAGICVLEVPNWSPRMVFPQISGVLLVLRTPDDLHILAQPPWWTPGRLLAVIGTLLAILVGIFIWNAALRRAATRKGRELLREQLGHVKANLKTEERTRLAVELHDTLAQNLTGVSMEIEAANGLKGNAPPQMLSHLDIAAKALKSCRDELRNCLWDLRSQALEEPDMNTAILRTLQPHVSDSRVAVRFNVPRAKISDNTAHALLRIIRELVINAIRHGNATEIKVAGSLDAEALRCSVTDNGVGFDPETAPGILQGHFGLQGIRERIEELGGTTDLKSAPGKGAKATISIPIPHEH